MAAGESLFACSPQRSKYLPMAVVICLQGTLTVSH